MELDYLLHLLAIGTFCFTTNSTLYGRFSFIEAFLYTISLTSIEVSNDIKKVKKQGDIELALNQRQMQIFDFLSLNQKITRGQVDKIMDLSFMTSFRELKDMETKGYIKQKGKGRGAYYVLSKTILEKEDEMTPKIE